MMLEGSDWRLAQDGHFGRCCDHGNEPCFPCGRGDVSTS